MNTRAPRPSRSLVRGAALGAFVTSLIAAAPALADTPSGWEDSPEVSFGSGFLVMFVIPVSLFAVIFLLAALPGMIKGNSYQPNQPWRSDGEWFGGPKDGLESADRVDNAKLESASRETGGASGSF